MKIILVNESVSTSAAQKFKGFGKRPGSVLKSYAKLISPAFLRNNPKIVKDIDTLSALAISTGKALDTLYTKTGERVPAVVQKVIKLTKLKTKGKHIEALILMRTAAYSKLAENNVLTAALTNKHIRLTKIDNAASPQAKRLASVLSEDAPAKPTTRKPSAAKPSARKPKPTGEVEVVPASKQKAVISKLTARTQEAVTALLKQAKRTKVKAGLTKEGSVVIGDNTFKYDARKNLWTTKARGRSVTVRDIGSVLTYGGNKPSTTNGRSSAKKPKAYSEAKIKKLLAAAKMPERISFAIMNSGASLYKDLGEKIKAQLLTLPGAKIVPKSKTVSIIELPGFGFNVHVTETQKQLKFKRDEKMESTSSNPSFFQDIANLVEDNDGSAFMKASIFDKRLKRAKMSFDKFAIELSKRYNIVAQMDNTGDVTFLDSVKLGKAMKPNKKYSSKIR